MFGIKWDYYVQYPWNIFLARKLDLFNLNQKIDLISLIIA